MDEFRFELRKGGGKDRCPACGKLRFVRYVDKMTGEQVADDVGRMNLLCRIGQQDR
ncbi:MAG: hypothetical protein HGB26_07290, partial [Desulfobulbaceae bacterium]|nr:hypothetical protein [Desulfobulbaceae bacterium]